MVGWNHQPGGHEFEQTLEDSEGQGSLVCCNPWGHKESGMTQQLNNNISIKQVAQASPHSSVGKESACNARDPGLIPMSGRSAGAGIDYPFQDSWASFMAQLVKNLPATWETWFQSLGWEDPLENGKVTHSSILAWRIPRTV